ncbi:MAG: hypothetical protein NVSMB65_15580 [Chloroflexota bacterium]
MANPEQSAPPRRPLRVLGSSVLHGITGQPTYVDGWIVVRPGDAGYEQEYQRACLMHTQGIPMPYAGEPAQ